MCGSKLGIHYLLCYAISMYEKVKTQRLLGDLHLGWRTDILHTGAGGGIFYPPTGEYSNPRTPSRGELSAHSLREWILSPPPWIESSFIDRLGYPCANNPICLRKFSLFKGIATLFKEFIWLCSSRETDYLLVQLYNMQMLKHKSLEFLYFCLSICCAKDSS
jgi:hypothetical protein